MSNQNDTRPLIEKVALYVKAARMTAPTFYVLDYDAFITAPVIASMMAPIVHEPDRCEQCDEPCDYPESCDCSTAHVCYGCFECECGKGWD